MAWLILFFAGLLEIAWAIGLKYTEGFTRLWPSVWTLLALVASFVLLGLAMKSLPVGTAYSVWVFLFQEPTNFMRIFSVCLILAGVIGLKMSSPS
jgi:quaternary ammonium compound-resistance protein SugE